ncbi:MAG: hypothetical protein K0U72_02700 [Gammaproteobacteria bacterium]|nr:hypothetical protein [Gammaproteobacteria bacterium]
MNKLIAILVFSLLVPATAAADTVLDKSTTMAISEELQQAVKNGDLATFKKYLFPGSEIVVDLDPAAGVGETPVSYSDYIRLLEMTLPMMQGAVFHIEVISVSVDERSNQSTIRERNTVTMDMMGTTIRNVSISETTFGIVDGQTKVLSATDQIVSSEQI